MPEHESRRPYLVGLTGSIGMGKTETAKLFAKLGIPVFDADAAVHALYDKDGAAVPVIRRSFPEAVKGEKVDRTRLAEIVKGDEVAFKRLEAIVHPLVKELRREFLKTAHDRGDELVVLDIPLLYETGGERDIDAVVVASAPAHVQRERVLKREGMTLEKLEAIHARQVPDTEKRAKADFVIETGEGLEHAFTQVKKVAAELRRRAKARM